MSDAIKMQVGDRNSCRHRSPFGRLEEAGATGLAAIRAVGGRAVIQDPANAEFPEMPANALATAGADFTVFLAEIVTTLQQLVLGNRPNSDECDHPNGWLPILISRPGSVGDRYRSPARR